MNNRLPHLWTEYDDIADVLYLTIGDDDPRVRTREDAEGFVWRYGVSDKLIGVTIFDFKHNWSDQLNVLAAKIAERLSVSKQHAQRVLTDA